MSENFFDLIECLKTFQGEGPDTGKRMLLCRFKSCNKQCPNCDTLVKMRNSIESRFYFDEIQQNLTDEQLGLMLTGGEPTLDRYLNQIVNGLNKLDYSVANVESNGCNLGSLIDSVDGFKPVKFIFSPKITKSSDNEDTKRFLYKYGNDTRLFIKIVVPSMFNDQLDLELMQQINSYGLNNKTYLMPLGSDKNELYNSAMTVFDLAEEFRFNVSTRMHLIYDFI